MERPDAVGEIEVVAAAAVRDDVDGAAQRVAAEADGNHAFVDFHTLDDVHGEVGQRHAGAFGIERHAVEEVADRVAAHPVDRQVELAAHAAFLADADAGRAVDGLRQRLEGAGLETDVERTHGEGAFAQLLLAALGRHGGVLEHKRIVQHPFHGQGVLGEKGHGSQKGGQRQYKTQCYIHFPVRFYYPKAPSEPVPAGLLARPFPDAFPLRRAVALDCQQSLRDLQQRCLLRSFTGFPFHPSVPVEATDTVTGRKDSFFLLSL